MYCECPQKSLHSRHVESGPWAVGELCSWRTEQHWTVHLDFPSVCNWAGEVVFILLWYRSSQCRTFHSHVHTTIIVLKRPRVRSQAFDSLASQQRAFVFKWEHLLVEAYRNSAQLHTTVAAWSHRCQPNFSTSVPQLALRLPYVADSHAQPSGDAMANV